MTNKYKHNEEDEGLVVSTPLAIGGLVVAVVTSVVSYALGVNKGERNIETNRSRAGRALQAFRKMQQNKMG